MYVITADQIASRSHDDRVDVAIEQLRDRLGDRVLLGPERTAGDEFQLLSDQPEAVLDALLHLTRSGDWSVGIGIGDVQLPLPTSTRAASGPAFFLARTAVERAKRSPDRFAVEVDDDRVFSGPDVEALLAQTLRNRAKRSPEGWELADLLDGGLSGAAAAKALGISPQAVSARSAAAGLRGEAQVHHALVRLLAETDRAA
ncbi:DNA-binding protein [Curtobacterium sp. MCPF17_050]|uniref:DNA-binding protein n=1 Tax=Curtobacterium sp. MCPF17_050 TaxID=2175664 RepID=UPI000D9AB716|nr:DNA-binding protein [Curtobacterium sp. MCPF17_050]WIB16992.1 DNA-binding protein [Curtobacterium sp. MCPF17_050]